MNATPWIFTQLSRPAFKPLSRQTEAALFQRLRAGDRRARERILNANTKFVVQVSRGYQNRGLPLEDVIAEGLLGLNRAIDRFEPATGYKFISYAVWWVRQAILLALAQGGRVVTLTGTRVQGIRTVTQAAERLAQQLEREPTHGEIAEAAGLTEEVVAESFHLCETEDTLHFEDEEGSEKPFECSGPLPDRGYEEAAAERYREALLRGLLPSERDVLLRYFGLRTGEGETLQEIGEALNLTRERIRQIKNRALARVKHRAVYMERLDGALEATKRNLSSNNGVTSIGEPSK